MGDQYGAFGPPMILPGKPEGSPASGAKPQPVSPPPGNQEIHRAHAIYGRELICEMRKTSLFLYDAFTEIVRKIYRDNLDTLIGTPTRKWGRTPQHDGIWIDTELNWKPAHPDFLPAIYVKLGQVQYQSPIGNQNVMLGFDVENAVHKYVRIGSGQVTFVHVAHTSGEAVALCDNTRYYLSDFGAQIADDLCLSKFFEVGVQPLAPAAKDSTEVYSSSSVFSYEFSEEWHIKQESPILKAVDLLQSSAKYDILALTGHDRVHKEDLCHQASGTDVNRR